MLAVNERDVRDRVRERIARYQSVFADKPEDVRSAALAAAEAAGAKLARERHHRVQCPACKAVATVQGEPFGSARVTHDESEAEVVVKQPIAPRLFSCSACGLRLDGYAELAAAGVGDHYTRATRYSPEEYFELLSPDDYDEIGRIAQQRLGFFPPLEEYDND